MFIQQPPGLIYKSHHHLIITRIGEEIRFVLKFRAGKNIKPLPAVFNGGIDPGKVISGIRDGD